MEELMNQVLQQGDAKMYAVFTGLILLNVVISITLAKKKGEFKLEKMAEFVYPLAQYLFLVALLGGADYSTQNNMIANVTIETAKIAAYMAVVMKYVKQTWSKANELYALTFGIETDQETFDDVINVLQEEKREEY